jgi:hypothetical protein
VHVTAATANFAEIEEWSPFYLGAQTGWQIYADRL